MTGLMIDTNHKQSRFKILLLKIIKDWPYDMRCVWWLDRILHFSCPWNWMCPRPSQTCQILHRDASSPNASLPNHLIVQDWAENALKSKWKPTVELNGKDLIFSVVSANHFLLSNENTHGICLMTRDPLNDYGDLLNNYHKKSLKIGVMWWPA